MSDIFSVLNRLDINAMNEADDALKEIGIDMTDALNLYFRKIAKYRDIPLIEDEDDLNDETLEAIKEARDISSGKVKAKEFHSVEELIKDCLSDEADD